MFPYFFSIYNLLWIHSFLHATRYRCHRCVAYKFVKYTRSAAPGNLIHFVFYYFFIYFFLVQQHKHGTASYDFASNVMQMKNELPFLWVSAEAVPQRNEEMYEWIFKSQNWNSWAQSAGTWRMRRLCISVHYVASITFACICGRQK